MKTAFLVGKAQTSFWNWYLLPENLEKNKLTGIFRFSNGNAIKVNFLAMPDVCKQAIVIEWFDSVGITVDVIPKINDNKVFFESNTFCLKKEVFFEDFVQFKTRQEAIESGINKANVIFNLLKT